MNQIPHKVTLRDDVRAKLGSALQDEKRPVDEIVNEAVVRYLDFLDGEKDAVAEGLSDIEAERIVPFEEVVARIDKIITDRSRKS